MLNDDLFPSQSECQPRRQQEEVGFKRNHLQKRKKRPETLQNNISEKDVHRGALIEWDEWDGWICGRAVQFIASY